MAMNATAAITSVGEPVEVPVGRVTRMGVVAETVGGWPGGTVVVGADVGMDTVAAGF